METQKIPGHVQTMQIAKKKKKIDQQVSGGQINNRIQKKYVGPSKSFQTFWYRHLKLNLENMP